MVEPHFPLDSASALDNNSNKQRDRVSGPDEFQAAEIYLPHMDRNEIAKVLGRKRDRGGLFIGRKQKNPILDSRIFTVLAFPDGDTMDDADSILAEHAPLFPNC